MKSRGITCLIAVLVVSVCSCKQPTKLIIEPIDQEFNQQYLTGERLDKRYFSTRDVMQYYQISNYNDLPEKQVMAKLDSFANVRYSFRKLDTVENLTLLFYRKQIFVDYRDHLYESSRDMDSRRLEGYSDDLIATITFERTKADFRKMLHSQLLYAKGKKEIQLLDTLLIR